MGSSERVGAIPLSLALDSEAPAMDALIVFLFMLFLGLLWTDHIWASEMKKMDDQDR